MVGEEVSSSALPASQTSQGTGDAHSLPRLFVHSFIQQILSEHLVCSEYSTSGNTADPAAVLMEITWPNG